MSKLLERNRALQDENNKLSRELSEAAGQTAFMFEKIITVSQTQTAFTNPSSTVIVVSKTVAMSEYVLVCGVEKRKEPKLALRLNMNGWEKKYLIYSLVLILSLIFLCWESIVFIKLCFTLQTEQTNEKLQSKLEQLRHHAA